MRLALFMLFCAAMAAAVHADWPQHQHDAGRSGYTADSVNPPYKVRWVWLNGQGKVSGPPFELTRARDLAGPVQIIVADGRCLFGTIEGVFYALNAESGAEVWRFEAPMPIVASAAANGGRVVFTCQDGSVYCLSIADGKLAWKYATGAGIWTAPAIDGDVAYVTSRDGGVYAIALDGGELKWKASTGAPIVSHPAVDSGKVFVGSEDCCAYAFDNATGKQLWKTPLSGGSFFLSWPVVTKDAVFFRMMSQFAWLEGDKEAEARLKAAGSGGWEAERAQILEHLAKHPQRRSFFALNPATGKEKFVVPMLYTSANGCAPTPPVIAGDGRVLAVFRPGESSLFYKGPTFGTAYTPDISMVDPATGDRAKLPLKNIGGCIVADNPGVLTMGGDAVYHDHRYFVSWMLNTRTGRYDGIIRNRESEGTPPYTANWIWTRAQAPNHGGQPMTIERGMGFWGLSGMAIANGRLYVNQYGGAVVCIEGTAGGGK